MAGGFKIGDVVELNSGGPKMTVAASPADDGTVLCIWFNNEGQPEKGHFPLEILRAAKTRKR
jgi:uncharacterized protein YodC (DUF2158 family)